MRLCDWHETAKDSIVRLRLGPNGIRHVVAVASNGKETVLSLARFAIGKEVKADLTWQSPSGR